jgi:dTDP-4-dehydrorhamnose 3,5-epimerase
MHFVETGIEDVWLVIPEPHSDLRGSFTRTFCAREFGLRGLATDFVQHSMSHSWRRHTLRGLHYQVPPHDEAKLVGCVNGAIWDVAVDLRADSPTFGRWFAAELTPENGHRLYVPPGCAHGFQTLADDSITTYLISNFYTPDAAAGLRYDDLTISIDWPAKPSCISDKDLAWPPLAELAL